MDEAGFRELFDAEFESIWRYARRRCACSQDADDITAETFAVVWRRRDDLPADEQMRLWLFGAARRVLANHRRGDARRERLNNRLAGLPSDVSRDPADQFSETSDKLRAALNSMPPDDRDLLVMRAWDEMAVTDIAHLMSCTPNAVSIRLTRARAFVRNALAATKYQNAVRTHTDRTPIAESEET